jgi:nicotinamidase-related amidase
MISSLVSNAFIEWEITQLSKVNYIMKGMNYLTEQYSAVKAVVENSEDISTHLNTQLIEILSTADEILIAGEALSHCVNYTVVDIADNIGEENIKKLVLLTDVSSNVLGCEKMGQEFLEKMVARGMRFSNTIEW